MTLILVLRSLKRRFPARVCKHIHISSFCGLVKYHKYVRVHTQTPESHSSFRRPKRSVDKMRVGMYMYIHISLREYSCYFGVSDRQVMACVDAICATIGFFIEDGSLGLDVVSLHPRR